ncbi:hypothetical protein [Carboxydothermus ferrireducens]|uniref:DUF2953 domain-containing protein n=1 Tax=Carboxydothermus ferrireducens DSM 11255 TaxID=1119529 RepID=A0ABX2RDH4_9THEO|nr:hypothetical protein [Carboxydothermus ferrireducens]NYE58657.1 hypothetical protein [Carboxydothermus ferrireducens DSM 11255]
MELGLYFESTEDVEINLVFRLFFGLLNFEVALPLPEFTEHFGGEIPVVGHFIFSNQKAVKKTTKVKMFRGKVIRFLKAYWDYLKLFNKTNLYFQKGLIIKKLSVELSPGLKDPFYFGIVSGVLYSLFGTLYALCARRFKKVERFFLNIDPRLGIRFSLKLSLLIEIPWYHLLLTATFLFFLLLKQKIKGIFRQPLVQIKGEK